MTGIPEFNAGPTVTVVTSPIADKSLRPSRVGAGNPLPANGQPEPVTGSLDVASAATTITSTDQNASSEGAVVLTARAGSTNGDTKNVEDVVRDLNDYVQSIGREIQFSLDDTTGRTIIRVVDAATDETIRQIPSEEIMDFLKNMQELNQEKGSLFEDQI